MLLNAEVFDGYLLIKHIHTVISIIFLIIAIWLLIRSVRGIVKNVIYKRLDKFLSYGFIINLYLQLIFGLILFSNPGSVPGNNYSNAQEALKTVNNRFWPIEHLVLMLFALFIANLGLILSNQTSLSKEKHKKILVYYFSALLMIAISLSAI